MIRVNGITLPLDYDEISLRRLTAKKLKIAEKDIKSIELNKQSVDARKKNDVHFLASVDVVLFSDEKRAIKNLNPSVATITEPYSYTLPHYPSPAQPPLVVGAGPAGLFAALALAQMGQNPILIERGKDVDNRIKDVQDFWNDGILDTESNVQFGEGGAGTFSDGKLTTGTKDKRSGFVLREFVKAGAPEEILYLAKPHIGTDKLRGIVKELRRRIIALGGQVLFETRLIDICIKNNHVCGAVLEHKGTKTQIETDNIILAIGHSARDTFEMLQQKGIAMEAKPFSIGARIEHLQEKINIQQYGAFASHPKLKAADYKLAVHLPNGRGVYTFCMCPGGTVVAAASEVNRLVTNGMSLFARDGQNANSALLVGVTPEDFGSDDVLAGVAFQRRLEEAAFRAGGGSYHAPISRVDDFLHKRKSVSYGSVLPTYKPACTLTNLDTCLPPEITEAMREGIKRMDGLLHGFADGDALLTAVESRSSSPVRILRNEQLNSINLKGLYPCGEGAGYAGGIISAAVDGIRCAEWCVISEKSHSTL